MPFGFPVLKEIQQNYERHVASVFPLSYILGSVKLVHNQYKMIMQFIVTIKGTWIVKTVQLTANLENFPRHLSSQSDMHRLPIVF